MSKKKRRTTTGAPEPRPNPAPAPKADKFRFRLASPWAVPAILALLTLLYFYDFPLSGQVIYGSDTGTDFHRGEEPFAEKLATYGPGVWKPTLGGYPASEEIRPDYFPASLLKLFTTHQRHLGWRFMLTVFFAGWGMYRYLRVLDLARWPCLWGGVAFMFAPTFLSFTFAGHYAKMAVIALLPWMYLCLHRGMQEGKLSRFLGLALLIGLGVYTPHVQMLQYALIAVGLYFLFQLYLLYRERREKRVLLARTGLFALAVALGVGIGSEGLFPPYLHATRESKRSEAATAERTGDELGPGAQLVPAPRGGRVAAGPGVRRLLQPPGQPRPVLGPQSRQVQLRVLRHRRAAAGGSRPVVVAAQPHRGLHGPAVRRRPRLHPRRAHPRALARRPPAAGRQGAALRRHGRLPVRLSRHRARRHRPESGGHRRGTGQTALPQAAADRRGRPGGNRRPRRGPSAHRPGALDRHPLRRDRRGQTADHALGGTRARPRRTARNPALRRGPPPSSGPCCGGSCRPQPPAPA